MLTMFKKIKAAVSIISYPQYEDPLMRSGKIRRVQCGHVQVWLSGVTLDAEGSISELAGNLFINGSEALTDALGKSTL